MTHKHNEAAIFGEQLASVCFESIGMAHEGHRFCWPRLSAVLIAGHVFSARANDWPSVLHRQRLSTNTCMHTTAAVISVQMSAAATLAQGMCSRGL